MKKLECKTKIFTRHAIQKMFQRNITKPEIDNVISNGEVIKEYQKDLHSQVFCCLVFIMNGLFIL